MNNSGAEFSGSSGAPARSALASDPVVGWDFFIFAFQLPFGFWRRALSAEGSGLAPPGSLGLWVLLHWCGVFAAGTALTGGGQEAMLGWHTAGLAHSWAGTQ